MNKKKNVKKTVRNIVFWLLMAVLIIQLLVVSLLLSDEDDIAEKIPYKIMEVSSDSMYPVLKTGDCIVTKKMEYDQINIGDIISFFKSGALITHEVVGTSDTNLVVTKGLQNDTIDGVIEKDEYVGTMIFRIPALGRILEYTNNPFTRNLLIGIVVVVLFGPEIFGYLYDLIFRKKEKS